jgi:hypothetical protein
MQKQPLNKRQWVAWQAGGKKRMPVFSTECRAECVDLSTQHMNASAAESCNREIEHGKQMGEMGFDVAESVTRRRRDLS